MDNDALSLTMRQIMTYLDHHPDSADTLAGIHAFWLQSSELPAVTQLALERLLEAGLLECVRYGRDQMIWRRCHASAAE